MIGVLFVVYWRESLSAPANSDSAASALQAWDMLHGNVLLHGWWVSDVSFYTTELPQYALIEAVLGLGPWVVHVAAAMTYTLVVVLTALVARDRARGAEGMARALLAGGIVMAPLSQIVTLLLAPDHTGTVVPVLATWLVIDRASQDTRDVKSLAGRAIVPLVVCIMLALAVIADPVVLLTAIAPLVIAAVVRALGALMHGRERLTAKGYELSLAVAALGAAALGYIVPRVITRFGGYRAAPPDTHMVPIGKLPHGLWMTFRAVLELFGADVFGTHPALELALVWTHLAGVLLAVCGLCVAVARFFRSAEIVVPALAVAIVLELCAFGISIHSQNLASVREIVAVMPFGAILAGRALIGETAPLGVKIGTVRWTWLTPVLGVVAAGYLGALVYGAAQPAKPSANQDLADWLTAHHLTYGLAGYWQAGSIALDTSGRVQAAGIMVSHGSLSPYHWETEKSEYDPARHDATFVVAAGPPGAGLTPGIQATEHTFGRPRSIYHADGYTILVWPGNLLRHLP